jgi:hypothetical protein
MALAHRAFGLAGVVVMFAAIIALTFCLLFRAVQRDNDIILSIIAVSLAVAASAVHWLARPHIFSWLFLFAVHYLLDQYQYRNKNRLYLLPLLMLPWVNMHGGFILGPILVAVYLFGNLARLAFGHDHDAKRRTAVLGLVLAGTFLAATINPYGYKILAFPFKLVSQSYLMDYVMEFRSPNFHDVMPFRYLLFLTLGILALSRARLDFIQLVLILLFTHMALYSVRYVPLFAIIATPILLRQAQRLLESGNSKLLEFFLKRSANLALVDSRAGGYFWPPLILNLTSARPPPRR